MNFKRALKISVRQDGFTFIEIIMASLILTLIVAAVVQYHSISGASRGQEYYLKAVQVARSEMEKLRALFEFDSDPNNPFPEFIDNVTAYGGLPNVIFLFKFNSDGATIKLPINPTTEPNRIFHVYYNDHTFSNMFLKSLGPNNTVKDYHSDYITAFNSFSDNDDIDKRTFTYFTDDGDTDTDSNVNGQIDASIAVIDDMGNPADPEDDLLGNIGWWVEDVDTAGDCKRITFVLQFWYPGQDWTRFDPEVIVLKTTVLKP